MLIACGGQASVTAGISPIPINQMLFFTVLVGLVLGARMALSASLAYLAAASIFNLGWPAGAGDAPLSGPMSGYLAAIPLSCASSGYVVDRLKFEAPVTFAMAGALGLTLYHLGGTVGLALHPRLHGQQAALLSSAPAAGVYLFQAAMAVLIACGLSSRLAAASRG
jgi:biotin transporter BioY